MWRLDLGEYGARGGRAAEEDPAEVAEPPEYPAADFGPRNRTTGLRQRPRHRQSPTTATPGGVTAVAIHLPLADPYQAPEGYSIKGQHALGAVLHPGVGSV